ncbi:uncharacterized protein LOC130052831 [Ostrea edulis]|uniref:uncharacterized protein LOC130052831 n=1 Tax=Ostrea edulis TaxID=37623 RepID=UPI0024AFBCA3|nr:uncharacterized protein LOC130052831 [Ostrea edulis]XP_056014892.1 uncharacterized protein LOC130052831 [Ostrea edulis]XP_056014893.1 uncharacterized protein LOC130052831 [Ostrea edulis]
MSGFPFDSSWLMVLLATCYIPNGVNSAVLVKRWTKCQTSFETVNRIPSCPTTDESYALRARVMKCESYGTCDGEPCVYHCAINPWGNATVEVCAPETLITDHYCPHFSTGVGRILEHYSYRCEECPFNYPSTTSYKYKSCYDLIKAPDHKDSTTVMSPIQKQPTENIFLQGESGFTLPNDSRFGFEAPTMIGIVLGILALIIFISVVVTLLYRRGKHSDFASCLQEKNTKNDTMDNNKAEIEDFLQNREKL